MLTTGLQHLCCMSPTLSVFCIPKRICTVKPNYKGDVHSRGPAFPARSSSFSPTHGENSAAGDHQTRQSSSSPWPLGFAQLAYSTTRRGTSKRLRQEHLPSVLRSPSRGFRLLPSPRGRLGACWRWSLHGCLTPAPTGHAPPAQQLLIRVSAWMIGSALPCSAVVLAILCCICF
jgi:hypothetical protein